MPRPERSLSHDYKGAQWEVSPNGAYIVRLARGETNLLFPDQEIDGKRRGGVFATIPQFGPDLRPDVRNMAQHGFGRTSEWRLGRVADAGAALSLERLTGPYAGLCASIQYRFNRAPNNLTTFYAGLNLYNDSDRVMRVAPAFHPYIDISRLDEQALEQTQRDLADAQTIPARQAILRVSSDEEVVVETKGFEKLTYWTDALGKYICVEPSLAGPSFSQNPNDPLDVEMLEPGDSRQFDMNMTWRPTPEKAFLRNEPSLRR